MVWVDRLRGSLSSVGCKKREIAMQTFEMIYYKLSEYYGFAVLDGWLWYLIQTRWHRSPDQDWQLFRLFDIYRCFDSLEPWLSRSLPLAFHSSNIHSHCLFISLSIRNFFSFHFHWFLINRSLCYEIRLCFFFSFASVFCWIYSKWKPVAGNYLTKTSPIKIMARETIRNKSGFVFGT